MLLIKPRRDHSLLFEGLEPRGQRVRRDAREPLLQIMKPQRTLAEQIPEHEQRPFFADDIEGLGNRAILDPAAGLADDQPVQPRGLPD